VSDDSQQDGEDPRRSLPRLLPAVVLKQPPAPPVAAAAARAAERREGGKKERGEGEREEGSSPPLPDPRCPAKSTLKALINRNFLRGEAKETYA